MTELERVRPWIEGALRYSGGTHTFEDVVQGIVDRRMQLWPGERSAAVTEILSFPRKKVLNTFLAGGDMDELMLMMRDAQKWARAQGCDTMTMSGRKGWLRVLNKHGWQEAYATMAVEL